MRKTARLSSSGQARLRSASAGQALLIILLVMAVVLTGALSIVSRSITDITVSQKEEESARAFSAAEAGIEQALVGGPATGTLAAGGEYQVSSSTISSGTEFIFPYSLNAGEIAPVWFMDHDEEGELACGSGRTCFSGNIKVCWGASGTPNGSDTTPAVEFSVFYSSGGPSSVPKIMRGAYDPNSSRRASNKFDADDLGGCTVGLTNFAFTKTVNLTGLSGLQFARLRILYNTDKAHPVGVSTGGWGTLPNQGTKIESTGTVGDVTRKIEFFRLFSDLPPVFDPAIFSGVGGITKSE